MGILRIVKKDPGCHYSCMYCETQIANLFDMEKINAMTGCYIFKKIFNIHTDQNEIYSKDIFCLKCNSHLGYQTKHKNYLFKSKIL